MTTVNKRQQNKDELKQRLLKSALTLFSRQGVLETTIEDVCKDSAIARRTFYNHFDSKQALIAALCDHFLIRAAENAVKRSLEKKRSTKYRLQQFFTYIADSSIHYQDLERQLLLEILAQIPASVG